MPMSPTSLKRRLKTTSTPWRLDPVSPGNSQQLQQLAVAMMEQSTITGLMCLCNWAIQEIIIQISSSYMPVNLLLVLNDFNLYHPQPFYLTNIFHQNVIQIKSWTLINSMISHELHQMSGYQKTTRVCLKHLETHDANQSKQTSQA